jgi:hypothetical protein
MMDIVVKAIAVMGRLLGHLETLDDCDGGSNLMTLKQAFSQCLA